MKALRLLCTLSVVAALAGASVPAIAQDKIPDELSSPTGSNFCDVTGYKTESQFYSPAVAIPDFSATGIVLGPIFMPPDGDLINDVVLGLYASHTWTGDLIVDLVYDPDCDGPSGLVTARVLCRPRGSAVDAPQPCGIGTGFGCSGDLVAGNTYLFSDDAPAPLGAGPTCTSTIPSGCYKQSEQGGQPFAIFRGLPKGGCWTLRVSDNAAGDTGAVAGWQVYVRNQRPVPTAATSWGTVKSLYR